MMDLEWLGETAEERQRYFEELCAMDEQEFQKLWESSDVYAKLKQHQVEIEALKDSNEHLAALLAETKAAVAREIFEEIEKQLAECDCFDRVFGKFVNLTIAELKKKYVKE